jgi:hypothetical protein
LKQKTIISTVWWQKSILKKENERMILKEKLQNVCFFLQEIDRKSVKSDGTQ